jgi:hypothetical protein
MQFIPALSKPNHSAAAAAAVAAVAAARANHLPHLLLQLLLQSPYAEELFAEPARGKLWLEQEQQEKDWASATQPWTWFSKSSSSSSSSGRPIWRLAKPVLQQLLAAHTMPLQEVSKCSAGTGSRLLHSMKRYAGMQNTMSNRRP